MMSHEDWYYSQNGEQIGPVTLESLGHLVASHQLTVDSLVWQVGTADWVAVREVAYLVQPLRVPVLPMPTSATAPATQTPWAGFGEQYGPRLQDLRNVVNEIDDTTGAVSALPHLRMIQRILEYFGSQVTVHQLEWIDRIMKRSGSVA